MNATAKVLNQNAAGALHLPALLFSKKAFSMLLLVLALLASALGVIYVKEQNRYYVSELQVLQATQHQLETEQGKLMLEESTWAKQSRIQTLAKTKLHMVMPGYPPHTIVLNPAR